MKKEYTKPELDTKAFAQFENVFTSCAKNAVKGCSPDTSPTASTYEDGSCAYVSNSST